MISLWHARRGSFSQMTIMIKATITDVLVYQCEKCGRNHKKGSKAYETCFSAFIDARSRDAADRAKELFDEQRKEKTTPPAPIHPVASPGRQHRENAPSTGPGKERGDGKVGVVAPDAVLEKVANYRATRWEYFKASTDRAPREPLPQTSFFSPAEMLQFAKRIAIAQGKRWHWWNEKKRRKDCVKAGIDPVNAEGQGDI